VEVEVRQQVAGGVVDGPHIHREGAHVRLHDLLGPAIDGLGLDALEGRDGGC